MKYDCLGGMPRPTGQLGVMGSSVSDYVTSDTTSTVIISRLISAYDLFLF